MLTVMETPIFQRYAAEVWDDEEREAFIDWVANHSRAGAVIPGTDGLRKVRWSRAGMGKRGGVRVIYFVRKGDGEIVLLIVYSKAKLDNLSPDFLHRLKEASNGP